jgi:hypothetical protein
VAARRRGKNSPRVLPKSECYRHGIDADLGPPCGFAAHAVKLAMMNAAQRHCELIRYLEAECARLCEPQMVGIAGLPATHGARLSANESKVVLVAAAARLHQGDAVDTFDGDA